MILTASNDHFSSGRTAWWLAEILGRDVPVWFNVAVRKCAHLVEYGILAALTLRAAARSGRAPRTAVVIALLLPLSVAVVDETLQSFTVQRQGSPGDVALDFAGASIALAIIAGTRQPH